jgi:hypothetical protein
VPILYYDKQLQSLVTMQLSLIDKHRVDLNRYFDAYFDMDFDINITNIN